MNPLLSKNSLAILESLSFTRTLYAFDFDGTLSKIVRVPSSATISEGTNALLKRLSRLSPVAILSGRGLSDLTQRLKFKPPYLVGNHGLEGLSGKVGSLESCKKISEVWARVLRKVPFGPGVEIEDKVYSLAVHYRQSRNKKEEKYRILESVAKLAPAPRVIPGKCVFNLIPPGAPHKGVALLNLMNQIGANCAFYIGDDDTDEDVFTLSNSNIMSVRVGKKLSSHAQYFVESQSDVNLVLRAILRNHERSRGSLEAQL